MTYPSLSGFRELSHTADLSLQVWAQDEEQLIITAVNGMFSLIRVSIVDVPIFRKTIQVTAPDLEGILVSLLNELLFILESERLVCLPESVKFHEDAALVVLLGKKATRQMKEIKAATYNRLNIQATPSGFETEIVFDV